MKVCRPIKKKKIRKTLCCQLLVWARGGSQHHLVFALVKVPYFRHMKTTCFLCSSLSLKGQRSIQDLCQRETEEKINSKIKTKSDGGESGGGTITIVLSFKADAGRMWAILCFARLEVAGHRHRRNARDGSILFDMCKGTHGDILVHLLYLIVSVLCSTTDKRVRFRRFSLPSPPLFFSPCLGVTREVL